MEVFKKKIKIIIFIFPKNQEFILKITPNI